VELKVIAMGESLEVYADDRLLIHNVRDREQRGRLGQMEIECNSNDSQPVANLVHTVAIRITITKSINSKVRIDTQHFAVTDRRPVLIEK
jgi:hypothetical protein